MTEDEYSTAYINGYSYIVRFIRAKHMSLEDSEDIAQSSWLKAWKFRSQYNGKSSILTWVTSIARNTWMASFRQHRSLDLIDAVSLFPEVEEHISSSDVIYNKILANDLLGQLPNYIAASLRLRYLEGISVDHTSTDRVRIYRFKQIAKAKIERINDYGKRRKFHTATATAPRAGDAKSTAYPATG